MALPASTDRDPVAFEPELEAAIAKARGSQPEPTSRPTPARMNPVAAGLFAALAGLVALVCLALAYVEPGTAPLVAPVAVILGAVSLWGASRIDEIRHRTQVEALNREKLELATTLERIADTAWELRENEERYRGLIEAQGDLVVHRDAEGLVTFANAAFLKALGIDEAAVVGKPLSLVPIEEVRGDDRRAPGDVEAHDLKLATTDGPRWFAWVDIRIRDNAGILGPVHSVARDITARKEVELALVEERKKAEAASQAKSRLLATVSHEFRTPLNGILGLNTLLLETPLTPVQETYARGVQSSGKALLGLIDDMLDFSKIEAERLDLRPESTDLEILLQEIVELLAPRAHAKGIDIVADIAAGVPALVSVDATRLRQVLVNLVGNGVKFTDQGGVTLAARAATTVGGEARLVFTVSDSGPGIAPEDSERLFSEFEQAEAGLNRRHGGAGLGLAISRRIVRRMGGELTVEPRAGGGSVFRFALDLPVEHAAGAESRPLEGRRVLVVMAEHEEAPAMLRGLARAGAEARQVANLNAAVGLVGAAIAAGLPYHAVLLDRRLMDDAAAALHRIHEAAGRKAGTVVLIEPAGRGEIESLRETGFDAYLVRPVRRSSLVRIVNQLVAAPDDFHIDPEDARIRSTNVPGPAPTSLDVLLAEDNEISALLARAVVEGLGHTVTVVDNGETAVAAVRRREKPFAVILMDLHMPGLDGLAAARAIRAYEAESGTPPARLVALTADVLPETRAEALAAGIDWILEKPVSPDSLRRLLADLTDKDRSG